MFRTQVFLLSLELHQKAVQRKQCQVEVHNRELAILGVISETQSNSSRRHHVQSALIIYLGFQQNQPSSLDSVLPPRGWVSILSIATSSVGEFCPQAWVSLIWVKCYVIYPARPWNLTNFAYSFFMHPGIELNKVKCSMQQYWPRGNGYLKGGWYYMMSGSREENSISFYWVGEYVCYKRKRWTLKPEGCLMSTDLSPVKWCSRLGYPAPGPPSLPLV